MLKLTAVLLAAMILAVIVTVIDRDQSADAMKAQKKSPRHAHTGNVGNQVCGDKLCSTKNRLIPVLHLEYLFWSVFSKYFSECITNLTSCSICLY